MSNTTIIFVLVCIVLLPFFIPPMNFVSSFIVGIFLGADAGLIAFLLSMFFFVCIMLPLWMVYDGFVEKRKEQDPAYRARKEANARRNLEAESRWLRQDCDSCAKRWS
jgi:hypothetical protein